MTTTKDALQAGFVKDAWGHVFRFGVDNEYELRFESLMFDNQMYVALYKDSELLTEKVVVKPGKEDETP
jgi:hypothetical protein